MKNKWFSKLFFTIISICFTTICSLATTHGNTIKQQLIDKALNADEWILNSSEKSDSFYTNEDFIRLEIESLYNPNSGEPWLNPQTAFGTVAIKKVCRPITNLNIIKARQSAIEQLLINEKLYQNIENQLAIIAENQDILLGYWDKDEYGLYKKLYFTQPKKLFDYISLPDVAKRLNNNPYVLEAFIVQNFASIFMTMFKRGLMANVSTGILDYFARSKIPTLSMTSIKDGAYEIVTNMIKEPFNLCDPRITKQHEIEENKNGINTHIASKISIDPSYTYGDKVALFKQGFVFNQEFNNNVLNFTKYNIPSSAIHFFISGLTVFQAQQLYTFYKSLYRNNIITAYKKMNSLHEHMVKISQLFKAIEEIEKAVDQLLSLEFKTSCLERQSKCSKKYTMLLNMLKASTFDKAGTVWYRRGNVLLAHKLMGEVKQELQTRLRNIGLMDSYLAAARFIKKAASQNLPVSFVHFEAEDQPVTFYATQLWCPVLNNNNQYVCNDVLLGGNKPRALILTGPNGCGKSTILRSMGVAAWLGQSFGVMPAENASISLFHTLRMSVPNSDNAQKSLSTYMSAAKQSQELMDTIVTLNNTKKGLILSSEPYRGTPDVQTDRKINEFCKSIVPNNQFIMALETHVVGPTKLEQEYSNVFVNGQMDIIQYPDGSFQRTFKLKDGPALWWFNDINKSSAFVDWISTLSTAHSNK